MPPALCTWYRVDCGKCIEFNVCVAKGEPCIESCPVCKRPLAIVAVAAGMTTRELPAILHSKAQTSLTRARLSGWKRGRKRILSDQDVAQIRNLRQSGTKHRDLMLQFKVSQTVISKALCNRYASV